ncbi:LysM peptidoglycan-binding domain-containing protein [Desulfovibrio sp. TomC]|uniref:LysM peptidoglycan-binding domain-containing protein n=1 Tax=Desulfovibrio sp. TomC TaxID=1562888 RepID=UPI000573C18B|nr:LysM peptidoglycan-binding domain-containing protein [Desulfovibrio sp. TomC]KHK02310.1 Tetratricopeptide repeat family protein [Desulfovibrio sp. TomC]
MPRFSAFASFFVCLGLALSSPALLHAYSVQAGDTPQSIAKKHNISVDELLKANKNLKPSKMLIGDTLVIPGGTPAKSGKPEKAEKSGKNQPEKEPAHDTRKDKASAKSEPLSAKERAAEARDRERERKAPSGHAAAGSYTVKKGDTFGSIAAKNNTTTNDLLKANKGLNPSKLHIGQEIALPGGAAGKAEPAEKASTKSAPVEKPSAKSQKTAEPQLPTFTHTVRKGDTPHSVARRYRISPHELARLNPDMGKKLHTGQKLVIPAAGAVKAAEAEVAAPEAEPVAAPERPTAKAPRTPEPADPTPTLPDSRDSADAEAAFEKGIEFGKQNKFQKAVESFDKAIKLAPNRADFFASRGHAHYYLAQYNKAIDDYTKAIEKNPNFALAYSMRGLSRARSDHYPQAIEDFNKAISLGPTEADYYKGRGFTYLRLKQYGPMCQDYQKACSLGDCELLESVKKEKLCQ